MVLYNFQLGFLTAVLALVLAHGQVIRDGRCPNPPVVTNFQLSQYTGLWYEIERYPVPFENGATCVTAEYTARPTGGADVNNTARTATGTYYSAVGQAYAEDPNKGALKVRFSPFSPYGPYNILDTDFTSYTVVFSCSEYGSARNLKHSEALWILSRTPTLPDAKIQELRKEISEKFELQLDDLKFYDRSDC